MGEKFWIQDFETGLDRLRVHFVTEPRDRGLAFNEAMEDIKSSWLSYRKVYEDKYHEEK